MSTEQHTTSPETAPTLKILLIDDDIELTQLISQFLSKNGFEVVTLHSGDHVLTEIQTLSPDLIVLDLMLPGLDGLTVCKQIRPLFHGPIIMLTALNDDIDEVTGLEVGADDYLANQSSLGFYWPISEPSYGDCPIRRNNRVRNRYCS